MLIFINLCVELTSKIQTPQNYYDVIRYVPKHVIKILKPKRAKPHLFMHGESQSGLDFEQFEL